MNGSTSTSATALTERPGTDFEDEFSLDIRVVVAAHPNGKLQCSTDDGCGPTCQNGASACNSFIEDPS